MKKIIQILKNKKGLTLVELLCTVAILGIVTTMVGGTMVTSMQSYSRGTSELDVQKESQFITNQITNLIVDATKNVSFANNILTIPKNETTYEVIYDPIKQELYYTDTNYDSEQHLFAENVSFFKADTSEYNKTGMVHIDLKVEKNNRLFETTFTTTSRNKNVEQKAIVPYIVAPNTIILEPNEIYKIEAKVCELANTNLKWEISLNGSENTKITQDGIIKIGEDENKTSFFVTITSEECDTSGTPKATKNIRVLVRRINNIYLYGMHKNGIDKKQGAIYEIESMLYGYNLEKEYGLETDSNYINPYQIKWIDTSNSDNLYEIISKNDEKMVIKLKRDMLPNEKITIRAFSAHSDGTNKTGIAYANIYDIWTLRKPPVYVILSDGGMKRNTNTKQGDFTQDFDNLAINDYSKKYEYRFKQTDEEEWSQWFDNLTGNANDNMEINLRPQVTATMKYNKDYDVQIRISIIDKVGNTVWPTNDVEEEDYVITTIMNRVTVTFNSNLLDFENSNKLEDPIEITVQKGNPFDLIEFNNSIGYEPNDIRNNLDYILEKKVNGSWKKVQNNEVNIQKGPSCKLKFETDNSTGEYRIKIIAKDMPVYTMTTNGIPQKETYTEDFILYDNETNNGIFYFNVK